MKDVALFESALRAAVPTRPDPSLGRTLVPRLAAAARASTVATETRTVGRPRSRRALVARVGIAVALIPLVLAGLAVAGVTVPKPARSAFDEMGITLPNQPAEHTHKSAATSRAGQSSGQGNVGTETGVRHPGKGNSQRRAPARPGAARRRRRARRSATSAARRSGLPARLPPGHSGQTGPPAQSNAGGSSGSHSKGPPSSPKPHTTTVPQGQRKTRRATRRSSRATPSRLAPPGMEERSR